MVLDASTYSYSHAVNTLVAVSHGFIAILLLFIYREMRRVAKATEDHERNAVRRSKRRTKHSHSRVGDPPSASFGTHKAGDGG